MLKNFDFFAFFGKTTLTGKFSKFCFERIHHDTDRHVQISLNLADNIARTRNVSECL